MSSPATVPAECSEWAAMPSPGRCYSEKSGPASSLWWTPQRRSSDDSESGALQRTASSEGAESSSNGRRQRDTAVMVRTIKEQAGLTWKDMGRIFGVSSRAVHMWAAGGHMNSRNMEALHKVNAVIQRMPDGLEGSDRRSWAMHPERGDLASVIQRNAHEAREVAEAEGLYVPIEAQLGVTLVDD